MDSDILSSPLSDHNNTTEDGTLGSIKLNEINLPEDFDSWTPCKQQAWMQIESNPNCFFYRHVLPGEEKKMGSWTQQERKLFIEAIKAHPPTSGHWGLFSRYIPGRVGYQCNAFYKKLLAEGAIPNIELRTNINPDPPKRQT